MLAIVGGKGGCGKTTTALGLARALASDGADPLVVDADCDMPNLHTVAETDSRPGLGVVADGGSVARAVHRSRACPGVDVLPAGSVSGSLGPGTLRRLARRPRQVILDCPAGASEDVARTLRAADAALVVSTTDRASLGDAAKTARMAEALETDLRGTVLTRTDSPDATLDRADSTGTTRTRTDSPDGTPDRADSPGTTPGRKNSSLGTVGGDTSAVETIQRAAPVATAVPEVDEPVVERRAVRTAYDRLARRLGERNI